jgi:uncharacterized protein (UPF0548 family)
MQLGELSLTYAEVGATAGRLPPGYRHVHVGGRLGTGYAIFERAADCVLSWSMHRAAGLEVHTTQERVTAGADALLRLPVGPFRISAPVRIVAEIAEPDRRGFAYGSLEGHPESGEERFVVSIDRDDFVSFDVIGFSTPATLVARLGGPVTRRVQDRVINRYVDAVRRAAAPASA